MSFRKCKEPKQMRGEVFGKTLETRNNKFREFLRYLRLYKFVAFSPIRGEFLESYYTLMRYLDDVVDGDSILPSGYKDESEYISNKIEFVRNPTIPKDEIDKLILYCFDLSKDIGKDFQSESNDILNSLKFDDDRRSKNIVFEKKVLDEHFYLMDIRGTVRATLKIFNEDPDKYVILKPLGLACRFQSNIEDYEEDLKAGYINIQKQYGTE